MNEKAAPFISLSSSSSDKIKTQQQKNNFLEPFTVFCMQKRSEIQKTNPNIGSSDVTSLLGKIWRSMDAVQRAPFNDMANQYNNSHKSSGAINAFHNNISEQSSDSSNCLLQVNPQNQFSDMKPTKIKKHDLCIPNLTIIPRSESSQKIAEISFEVFKNQIVEEMHNS